MPFSAIILDFDGLIIDSETPLLQVWQEIYTQHGGTLTLDLWKAALGTHHGFDPYAELERQTGTVLPRERWMEHVRLEHRRRCELERLQPGVLERLEEARTMGLGTAVASSSTRAWVDPWLTCHHIRDLVDVVCTRDDVARVKPAPDLFLLAAERIGTAPAECVVFEDSPNGLLAAHAAKMWAVAVPRGLTRKLALPEPHAVIESLAACTLGELRAMLDGSEARAPFSRGRNAYQLLRRDTGPLK